MVRRAFRNKSEVVLNLRGSENWLSDTFFSPMICEGRRFNSVYQYMAYSKAVSLRNYHVAKTIQKADSFDEIRKLDKSLELSAYSIWTEIKDEVHSKGVIQKFRGSKELQDKLLALDVDKPVKVIGGKLDLPLTRSIKAVIEMEVLS